MVGCGTARVLVVDASEHIRRLIATVLEAVGPVQVIGARSSEAAVPLLVRHPDLVIVDWTADPTGPLLLTHRIRRGGVVDGRIPVLAMASSTHHAVLERAWQAGIDEVIVKPLSAMDVIQRSRTLLSAYARAVARDTAEAAE
jgi:two-component system, OmpR family, phosphate regulon response regulator PhoB